MSPQATRTPAQTRTRFSSRPPYDITYGGNDAQGLPEIVKYSSNSGGSTSSLFADPVTGQATMLTTSSDIATLYVYDGLANPVGLLADFATNTVSSNFDPYGIGSVSGSGGGAAQNPYSFHSGIQDRASGLVKFGLRWYNPTTGTWTQQDTVDAPLDPANANRYVFVRGDPIDGLDPTGQSAYTTSQLNGLKAGFVTGAITGAIGMAETGPGVEAGAATGAIIGGLTGLIGAAVTCWAWPHDEATICRAARQPPMALALDSSRTDARHRFALGKMVGNWRLRHRLGGGRCNQRRSVLHPTTPRRRTGGTYREEAHF